MEREVLKLMPANTIDFLMLGERDVDAIDRVEVNKDSSHPDHVAIRTFYKTNTKLSKDMEGFTSSQL